MSKNRCFKKTELPNVINMEETNLQIGVNTVEGWEDLVLTQFH